MSTIADINGIWIADDSTPVGKCGILVRYSDWKKDSLQQFHLRNNQDFKLVVWVTGKEAGRRIFLKATIHKTAEALSLSDLGMSNWIDIKADSSGVLQHVIWKWPKTTDWKISGKYEVKVALGYIEGPNLQTKPKWDPAETFTFEVVNP